MADVDIQRLVEDKLGRYGDQIVTRIREKLLAKGALTTGDLYNSITYEVAHDSGVVSLNIYALDYFQWVDKGRPPGKRPPMNNILSWVRTRGLRPSGNGIPVRDYGLPRGERSLAFMIARKIGLEGIKPANILSTTLEEVDSPLTNDINDLIVQAITEIIGKQWEELARQLNNDIIQILVNY